MKQEGGISPFFKALRFSTGRSPLDAGYLPAAEFTVYCRKLFFPYSTSIRRAVFFARSHALRNTFFRAYGPHFHSPFPTQGFFSPYFSTYYPTHPVDASQHRRFFLAAPPSLDFSKTVIILTSVRKKRKRGTNIWQRQ